MKPHGLIEMLGKFNIQMDALKKSMKWILLNF